MGTVWMLLAQPVSETSPSHVSRHARDRAGLPSMSPSTSDGCAQPPLTRYTVNPVLTRVWSTAVLAVVAFLTAGVLAGCSSPSSEADSTGRLLRVGAGDTSALKVMAEIYAGALRDVGAPVAHQVRIGDDTSLLADMDKAALDLFPAFGGDLLSALAPSSTTTTAEDVYDELNRSLPQGVSVGDATPVSATPQVFVATSLAQSSNATDLSECGRLPAGMPVVVVDRAEPGVMSALAAQGCRFGPVETVGSVREVIARVGTGDSAGVLSALDAAVALDAAAPQIQALRVSTPTQSGAQGSTAPDSAAPDSAAPGTPARGETAGPRAQNLVPVFRTAALTRSEVKQINRVAGEITTADLAELARRADEGAEPRDLAVAWLGEHSL
ncbi:glycine/betaine ABC transporter substrate-binding protein [Gordonia otitidis]|uniref:glycine betaine ABC transporter substrate-binding protein n=1 Tax=Gordonia otitidis TaxID=249058 RepID=UPI001D158BD0|nr:glycine/betaine ABC transporter substrate-binding protein [Gordonia otitidis]